MGSNATENIPSHSGTESSEPTIEIKIKTLDSQTYTLRVDKEMPVPALKEQIASVTGVLSERQRLICQGKVLKDDQLLSAYHVEDGHTLHLVVRQPDLPSPGNSFDHSVPDPNSGTSHGHSNQVAPGVFIETFDVPLQGDGISPDFQRVVSAVLGSIGISMNGSDGIDTREQDSQGFGRTSNSSGIPDSSHPQSEQAGGRILSDRMHNIFGPPSVGSLQPPVIPDSLTTLSQYLSRISHEFDAIVREGVNNGQAAEDHRSEEMGSISSRSGSTAEGIPSPASLAEVLRSSRRMIVEQVGECLLQLASQLENQANITDSLLRSSTQSRAMRTGVLFYNLGAFLLELGRTTMTTRLGQTASEAVVNGGPAVFISPSGPNHIMVQPIPFHPGASFGAVPVVTTQSNSSLGSGLGSSFIPRRIDIQIRRGTSTTTSNANQEERNDTQSAAVQRNQGESSVNQAPSRRSNASLAGEPGIRVVPIRTMVAAVPGSILTPSTRQEPSNSRVVNINILSAGGAENNPESERQIQSSVLQHLRALFPGGDIHVEDSSLQGTAAGAISEHAATLGDSSHVPEAEPRASDEGIFLSNILREIMPLISQRAGSDGNPSVDQMAQDSSTRVETDAGTSRRGSGSELDLPNPKRQKTEKAFLKQPKVFLSSKKSGKGKRPGKGGNRFWKSIGLGFKTPREAIDGTYIDKKCPFTGNVSIRGRILSGTCHSAKMNRTIIVRRNYLHFIKKYQRYEKRHSNIPAHVSPCFRVKEGDHVIIGQCRPISKTVRFNVLKVIPAGSSGGAKKAFTGI
ncbi:hypothetical protein TanjilG_26216 [Lupinus angustifolius]|uniref:Small ribosomal subunit protein uS17 n=1 Tax=Lupinus angustifolius TaxID=3871 RepID=A0A4P1R309_LUPAN|nr:hypothetical protein TanjilG_26216 [Lupinus angustifolius]